MKILVQFPTRGRRDKFFKTLRNYQEYRRTDNVSFHIVIDADDKVMNTPETLRILDMWGNVTYDVIEPCGKIGAINYGLDKLVDSCDIIFLASDDMNPIRKGWDARIIEDMTDNFPDTDGVLWYNDGKTEQTLNTLSILGRKYFKRFGYIYNSEYKALWCDNEFMEVADILGKQKYFPDIIIRHEHPIWGYGSQDELHHRDNKLYQDDKETYLRRKGSGFGIEPTTIEHIDTDGDGTGGDVRTDNNGDRQADKPKRGRPAGAGSKPKGQSKAVNRGKA